MYSPNRLTVLAYQIRGAKNKLVYCIASRALANHQKDCSYLHQRLGLPGGSRQRKPLVNRLGVIP